MVMMGELVHDIPHQLPIIVL